MSTVRVRFAPSPTGELHVGGLRTALFNYLFARKHGGDFILRIEDTDRQRYVASAEQGIIDALEWAGLSPDEGPDRGGPYGPYRQSERLPLYREAAETLIQQGNAYHCYCRPEDLEEMRRAQQVPGQLFKYDGRCRHLTDSQRAQWEAEGRKPVVRMRIPEQDEPIVVRDLVRGNVVINSGQLDDQVLLKSDGFPTYHLAVVTDDHAMGITHVLRAEEWLPSTPKHLYLLQWLGWEAPQFAHLPLLLNADRSKMSKRKGDVATEDYRRQGYLPEALVNFLALLGWNPGDEREIMAREELIAEFSIERIGKAGAAFDRPKLDWMNQAYLQLLSPDDLWERLRPFIAATPYGEMDETVLRKIAVAVQPALVTLADIGERMRPFLRGEDGPLHPQVRASTEGEAARAVFRAVSGRLRAMDALDQLSFQAMMKDVQKETNIKGKALWGPMRAAITLEPEGPDLALMVDVFGREKTLARVERFL